MHGPLPGVLSGIGQQSQSGDLTPDWERPILLATCHANTFLLGTGRWALAWALWKENSNCKGQLSCAAAHRGCA